MNHRATALGLISGLALGLLASVTDIEPLDRFAAGVAPLGTLFINAIRMVVIPLVVTTIFVGVARLGNPKSVGKLGGSALGFFWGTTVPAIVIGMGFMKIAMAIWPVAVEVPTAVQSAQELPGLLDLVLRLIPANPFAAAADGALLPLIVFTLLMAAAAGALEEGRRHRLVTLAEDLGAVFVRLIHWILWTAPAGVFGLAAPAVARMGLGLLTGLAVFVGTVVVGLFVFMALFYLPAVRFLGKKGLGDFVRGVKGSYVIGFSTTSSVASLPVMFEDAEALGVSPAVSSLVLSLGAAINRAGSALFQAGALVFLAALYGVPLPFASLVSAGFVGFVVAMSVAPVPSASIVTLAPILEAAGVPLAGLGLLLGIDRIPDMFRSATNITGHVAAAVTVEGLCGGDLAEDYQNVLQRAGAGDTSRGQAQDADP